MSKQQQIERTYQDWWIGMEIIPPSNNPDNKSYPCTDVRYSSQASGTYGVCVLKLEGYGDYIVGPKGTNFRPNKSDVKILK